MITIKNKSSIAKMEKAGQLLLEIFEMVGPRLVVGANTLEIDSWIASELKKRGLVTRMKGYNGYQHVSCVSVNDVVVHGIPSATAILNDGDLVKVDVCASYNGYCADMARCFVVGTARPEVTKLITVAKSSLDKGIAQAVPGNRLSDISAAIAQEIDSAGFGIVRDFAGHGIGKLMHEEPEILNYGKPGTGPVLRAGMAFAIEPMLTIGKHDVYITKDKWTAKTVDGSWAAHVEDTIVITDNGPKILTRKINAG